MEFRMTTTRIAIAGLGAIGKALATRIAAGSIPGTTLACVAARDAAKARAWLDEAGIGAPVVALDAFPDHADLAVECAPAAIIEEICAPMLKAGKKVMVLSCGALLPRPQILELAKAHGGQIIVPTGALLGLDAVTAAAEGTINSVRMTTRKPPRGLVGAPYLAEKGLDMDKKRKTLIADMAVVDPTAGGNPVKLTKKAALGLLENAIEGAV